jgi:tRNA1(Val) A37 N6-methylase TrmN6
MLRQRPKSSASSLPLRGDWKAYPHAVHNGDAAPKGQGKVGVKTVADTPQMAEIETTQGFVLGRRLRLAQPRRGYRAGMDAALLAAAVALKPSARALEIGCGAGGALLQAAARNPQSQLLGLERDRVALALCQTNIAANALGERTSAMAGEVGAGFRALGQPRFDAAFANPPFFDDPAALRGPSPERAGAWLADDGLGAWLTFLVDAVKDGGQVVMIHRADRLGDILAGLAPRAGSVRIRPVQPHADEPAKRVLVKAVRGGRAPLVLLPPLVLHARGGAKHTAEADAILQGEAALDWG